MIADIRTHDLTVTYGDTVAIDRLSLDLPAGKIYGLLGRNGSGKTTLLSVLASYRRASSGSLTIGGVDPFENADVMRQTSFIRDALDVNSADRIRSVLTFADGVRPSFDRECAAKLLDIFELDPGKRVSALSRGQKSSLGGVRAATVYGRLDPDDAERASSNGLTLGPVGIQDLFVHLTTIPRDRETQR